MSRDPSQSEPNSASQPQLQANGEAQTPLAPQRLLVRGVNWLGDAVMTTPSLRRLREAFPSTHITLFTHQKLAGLWIGQPTIDEVLTFQQEDQLWSVARRLRKGRYDLGLALPNSHRSALELWLAGIPRRIGMRAPARSWLFTHPVEPRSGAIRMRKRPATEARRRFEAQLAPETLPPPNAHQIHHYLHLAAAAGASSVPAEPRLEINLESVCRVQEKFALEPNSAWLALNPGAEYGPAKRWPPDHFAAAAAQLQRQTGCRCVILGGAADRDIAHPLAAAISRLLPAQDRASPPLNLAGRTNLQELCAVLKCCRVLLTNDSGPMHVAAALGIPVVVPFGSTSPELTGPGLPGDPRHRILRHRVPCSPCFLRTCPLNLQCLTGITVEQVVLAVKATARWT